MHTFIDVQSQTYTRTVLCLAEEFAGKVALLHVLVEFSIRSERLVDHRIRAGEVGSRRPVVVVHMMSRPTGVLAKMCLAMSIRIDAEE